MNKIIYLLTIVLLLSCGKHSANTINDGNLFLTDGNGQEQQTGTQSQIKKGNPQTSLSPLSTITLGGGATTDTTGGTGGGFCGRPGFIKNDEHQEDSSNICVAPPSFSDETENSAPPKL